MSHPDLSEKCLDLLQETGLVEKSGQGVDKMFANCVMEAKPLPDFSDTDNYQVSLTLRTEIRDIPFLVYIRQEQAKRPQHHKLNVFQLIAIYDVCFGEKVEVSATTIDELVLDGILLRSKKGKLSMSKDYTKVVSELRPTKSELYHKSRSDANDEVNDEVNDKVKDRVTATYLIIIDNPGIKRKRISELLGKSLSTVDRCLAFLIKEDMVEHRDSNKTGGYYVKEAGKL